MDQKKFKELTDGKIILLDGATGTCLQKAGMPAGVCQELWASEHPDVILELQKGYVDAGSQIIYAPTFTANRYHLREYGLQDETVRLNRELVELSKAAAGGRAYVAGDLSMTGAQLYPMGDMGFDELVDIYKEQITALAEAGADLLVVETMMSLQEARAAVIAARETCSLPVMATMTFQENGRTLYGTDPSVAAAVLQDAGADAVGINCSAGPDLMVPMIEKMAVTARVPLIAKPNAGKPSFDKAGNAVYDMDPGTFCSHAEKLINAGACIIGGCCGTTQEHIRALAERAEKMPIPVWEERSKMPELAATERTLLVIDKETKTESIICSRDTLKNLDALMDETEEKEDADALLIIFEDSLDSEEVQEVLETVREVTDKPLGFQPCDKNVLALARRYYAGCAFVR